jgi:hypothetical protein
MTLALAGEGSTDLDAEVDLEGSPRRTGMAVDEDVVAVGSKTVVPTQEGPDLVEGRPPSRGDLADGDAPVHGRDRARCGVLHHDLVGHG